jgi:hypothetical protein
MTHNVYAPPHANVDVSTPTSAIPHENSGITFDNLASSDKWRFVWGFFWRSVCVALLSMLGGGVAGAVIGLVSVTIAQVLGNSLADVILLIRILGGTAGLLVGFASLWQLIRWCFRTRWFGHRLRFVKDVA